jgi:hypothetical protein
MVGSPAILGSFVALERRGGSEDPWLCVTSFCWFCLCQDNYEEPRSGVNSGMYLNGWFGFTSGNYNATCSTGF